MAYEPISNAANRWAYFMTYVDGSSFDNIDDFYLILLSTRLDSSNFHIHNINLQLHNKRIL